MVPCVHRRQSAASSSFDDVQSLGVLTQFSDDAAQFGDWAASETGASPGVPEALRLCRRIP